MGLALGLTKIDVLTYKTSPERFVNLIEDNFRRIQDYSFSTPTQMLNGIELYAPNSAPYIDFHRAIDPSGDAGADYNMRLVNGAAGELQVLGGKFVVNSSTGTNVVSTGTGGGYEFAERDSLTNKWVWYANASRARLWRGGDLVTVDTGGRIYSGLAAMGTHPIHSTYAWFGRADQAAAQNYALLIMTNETLLNGPNGVYLSENGTVRFYVTASEVHTAVRLNVSGGLKVWSDWLRVNGNAGLNWDTHGGQFFMQDGTWIRANRGIYTPNPYAIMSEGKVVANAQYGSTGFYIYNDTDTNHRIWYDHGTGGDTWTGWLFVKLADVDNDMSFEVGRGGTNRHVNVASSAWKVSEALAHNNMSDPRFKESIQQLEEQKELVKTIKPIKFKWDEKHDPEQTGRVRYGFNADELPEQVTNTSFLIDEETGEPVEVKMMDPVGVLAILWEAFLEEEKGNIALEHRVAAIERKLNSGNKTQ